MVAAGEQELKLGVVGLLEASGVLELDAVACHERGELVDHAALLGVVGWRWWRWRWRWWQTSTTRSSRSRVRVATLHLWQFCDNFFLFRELEFDCKQFVVLFSSCFCVFALSPQVLVRVSSINLRCYFCIFSFSCKILFIVILAMYINGELAMRHSVSAHVCERRAWCCCCFLFYSTHTQMHLIL